MLLIVYKQPRINRIPICFHDMRKLLLLKKIKTPNSTTEIAYLKNNIASIDAPAFINGKPNNGLKPYVIPVIIPAKKPINEFLFIPLISVDLIRVQNYNKYIFISDSAQFISTTNRENGELF